MSNLQPTAETKTDAQEALLRLLERKKDLEDMFVVIQPLLYHLSVAIYGEHDLRDVKLAQLIEDGVKFIDNKKETLQ
jgi:hypothetical protein